MIRRCVLLACLPVLFSCASASDDIPNVHLTPGPAPSKELTDEIAREDSAFFDAVFNKCDLAKIGDSVTEDFEFYHDKGGLTATSRAQFVESMRDNCEKQKQGTNFLSRRELVKDSLKVYPLNNYGAIEVGVHRFYAIAEGKKDRLTETAKFTQVWKKEDGKWRITRVLSYDHVLAE